MLLRGGALARSIFRKGAHFTSAMAFEMASTNLVVELGIIMRRGSGLGLSMVQGFAAQSGGAVQIASSLGKGTTVELWLPPAERQSRASVSAEPGEFVFRQRQARILVCDDDKDVCSLVGTLLRDLGHLVWEAAKPTLALQILERERPVDLLLVRLRHARDEWANSAWVSRKMIPVAGRRSESLLPRRCSTHSTSMSRKCDWPLASVYRLCMRIDLSPAKFQLSSRTVREPRSNLLPPSNEPLLHHASDLGRVHAVQPQPLDRAPLARKVIAGQLRTIATSASIAGVPTLAAAPSALIGMRPVGTSSVMNL